MLFRSTDLNAGVREFMDPLLVADFDGDGFPEPALLGANRVWWNRSAANGTRTFVPESLASLTPDPVVAAARADLDGDGLADLLLATPRGLELLRGIPGGRISATPQPVWSAAEPLRHPQAMAVGDVDGDGDQIGRAHV